MLVLLGFYVRTTLLKLCLLIQAMLRSGLWKEL
jgi:hypothetical protein